MTLRATLALAVLLSLAAATVAEARPGDLDRRYGKRGLTSTARLEGGFVGALDRGGIVVAGGTTLPGVMRFNRRGALDRRFGRRGAVGAPGAGTSIPSAIRRERSGAFAISTISASITTPPAQILRVAPRGRSLTITRPPDALNGPIVAAPLRPGGGAFVLASRCSPFFACNAPAEVRALRGDGTTDASFGGGTVDLCKLVTPCQRITAGAVRPDGRLLVALVRGQFTGPRLVQLTPAGALDPSFGSGGVATLPFRADRLRLDRRGAILALGRGARRRLARLTKLTTAGARVGSFGSRGIAQVGPRGPDSGVGRDVVTDRSGRIYVLADRIDAPRGVGRLSRRPFVTRLTPRGRTYRRFGRRGTATVRPPGENDTHVGSSLVLDTGGILIVGELLGDGQIDPVNGCGIRDDLCAERVRLAVWRLRR